MNRIKILFFLLATIAFASTPFIVHAQQISPNPNPSTGTITVDTRGAYNSDNPFDNYGSIFATDTGTLTNNGTLNNYRGGGLGTEFGGRLNNLGTLNNYSSMANNGAVTNYSGGTLNNYGQLQYFHGPFDNSGTLNNYSGGTIQGDVSFGNGGTLNNSGTLIMDGTSQNGGTLNNNNGGSLSSGWMLYNSGTLNNNNGGTLGSHGTLYNNGTVNNSGTLINESMLTNSSALWNGGTISGTGTYIQTAGSTINNGSLTQTSIDIQGGILSGNGTITGNIAIGSGASVQPGNSPGILTINGNFSSSGSLLFEISGPGIGQDLLDINGSATFTGGNIEFDFIDGYSPPAGTSWDCLLANSITGGNTLSFTVDGLGNGLGWEVDPLTEILSISSVPEPSTLALLGMGLVGFVAIRRRFKK